VILPPGQRFTATAKVALASKRSFDEVPVEVRACCHPDGNGLIAIVFAFLGPRFKKFCCICELPHIRGGKNM